MLAAPIYRLRALWYFLCLVEPQTYDDDSDDEVGSSR